ncbi:MULTISPECIES: hypothetical protein [Butyricimonas]|uniref:hypothetical protein n=1 Tax=Butyricimonas TaxID=574697 RepID=UPI0007FB31C0|nr:MULTISPECIES: hypothetical protein [Butyricimonas]
MKCCYLLFISLLFACVRNVDVKSQQHLPDGTLKSGDEAVIQELKNFYESLKTTSCAAQRTKLSSFAFFENIDAYTVLKIPYYVLNQEKFYENPSPKQLMNNLYQPDEKKWFVGMGRDTVLFTAEKQDSVWIPRTFILDWGKVISWLPAKLKKTGANDYKIFELGNNIYITFKRNETNIYYVVTGLQEWSEAQFCGLALDYINQRKASSTRKFPMSDGCEVSPE